jgi:hypothetical protein
MSAFRFDEANRLQREIAPLETERQALAQVLPRQVAVGEPPTGIVPVIGRPPRRGRARPRR